ncbi:hypothetical protein JK358_20625 [Nocardia sp. 2]|uniref:Uncharacterized protein n=1 Tax=Nocardia acididurans TaxID=2802282 RepID=A0ABS1M840_9NOCA|nr:hypothetical protein [Nocardia acididurans]MBL1076805.1 hypothetical protein [Nocardia acididurans]
MKKSDWLALRDAAECAGMGVEAYIAWSVRLLALQARAGGAGRHGVSARPAPVRRRAAIPDDPESAAWTDSFAERLSHRAEQFRDE